MYTSPIDLGLSTTPDHSDPETFQALANIHDAVHILNAQINTFTGKLSVVFSEIIAPGKYVNLFNNAGVLTARLAGYSGGTGARRAYGFCVTAPAVIGGTGEITFIGFNEFLAGLTLSLLYYLDQSGLTGDVTSVLPSTAGNIVQQLGYSLSNTILFSNPVLNPLQL